MYRRFKDHSSFCSSIMAPTSRVMAASLGKMSVTLPAASQAAVAAVEQALAGFLFEAEVALA
jgi:hypothetical protein